MVLNNELYAFGGSKDSAEVWSSPDGITWRMLTNQAGEVVGRKTVAVGYRDKLWVLGGICCQGGDGWKPDVWSSPNGVVWKQENDDATWLMREQSAGVVFNDKVWLVGGAIGNLRWGVSAQVWTMQE